MTECLLAYSSVISRFLKMIKTKSLPPLPCSTIDMFDMWIWESLGNPPVSGAGVAKANYSLKIMIYLNMTQAAMWAL